MLLSKHFAVGHKTTGRLSRIASRTPTMAEKLDGDLKAYYERKIGEGKSKLSVLNAVKNKLLARVIAVVNKQELYVKKVA